ncbi:unnamed protein product [Sphagnum balticum]
MSQDLSASGFGEFVNYYHNLEASHRSDLLSDQCYEFLLDAFARTAVFEDYETYWDFSLELLYLGDHCHFGEGRMPEELLLYSCGGQSMSRSVDDIVKSGHYIQIAIRVEVTCISSGVVAWCLGHIFLEEGLVVVVEGAHEGGRHGEFNTDLA